MWQINDLSYPLFVQSRRDPGLVANLLSDSAPIWFEGMHTLYHFEDERLKDRKKFIRMHNVESVYYRHLGRFTASPLIKMYYHWESNRCQWLEDKLLNQADGLFSISEEETKSLNQRGFPAIWLPPFHPHSMVSNLTGKGEYALYHGDLSIRENEDAALFLIEQVFSRIDFPLVIAGHRPSKNLIHSIKRSQNTRLLASPSFENMKQLLLESQMILLPFSQSTGYKMKMIDSLAMGRHIVTSNKMKVHTELNELVYFEETPKGWIDRVNQLKNFPFTDYDRRLREILFETVLNNSLNTLKILEKIFPS